MSSVYTIAAKLTVIEFRKGVHSGALFVVNNRYIFSYQCLHPKLLFIVNSGKDMLNVRNSPSSYRIVCKSNRLLTIVSLILLIVGCTQSRSHAEVSFDTRAYFYTIYSSNRAPIFYYDGHVEHREIVEDFVNSLNGITVYSKSEAEFIVRVSPRIGFRKYTSIDNPSCRKTDNMRMDLIDARISDGSENIVMYGGWYYTRCKGIRKSTIMGAISSMRPNRNF